MSPSSAPTSALNPPHGSTKPWASLPAPRSRGGPETGDNSFFSVFTFDGAAPEVINCRLATVGHGVGVRGGEGDWVERGGAAVQPQHQRVCVLRGSGAIVYIRIHRAHHEW